MNISAPDEGNMHMLELIATDAQKERFLRRLARAEVRSCFAMTEPAPGAGADPNLLCTEAKRDGDHYVVNGVKWLITGAQGAAFAIIMARTEEGATMLLSDMEAPGIRIERVLDTIDQGFAGGHAVLRFENLRVPVENVLGAPGQGFKYAQVRLAPARLTHCMRWLGLARRALEIALPYVKSRQSFGHKLIDREGVQWMLGEAAMQIEIGRLLTMRAAWKLDRGDFARKEVSMAKVAVADVLHKSIDTAIQLMGARGYSKDTPLEWMYRYARQARLVDGASEVHKMVLARVLADEGTEFWGWR
jgi:acyl-CoA dehydrogenase